MELKMKMYMGYDGYSGAKQCACLIFAYSARQAKKISYKTILEWFPGMEFIDIRVKLIRHALWLWEEKLKDEPHVIDDPKSCRNCFQWGHSIINDDGFCRECIKGAP